MGIFTGITRQKKTSIATILVIKNSSRRASSIRASIKLGISGILSNPQPVQVQRRTRIFTERGSQRKKLMRIIISTPTDTLEKIRSRIMDSSIQGHNMKGSSKEGIKSNSKIGVNPILGLIHNTRQPMMSGSRVREEINTEKHNSRENLTSTPLNGRGSMNLRKSLSTISMKQVKIVCFISSIGGLRNRVRI